mgnify:CR=1 FL=1
MNRMEEAPMSIETGFVQIAALFGAGLTGIAALRLARLHQRKNERVPVKVRAHRRSRATAAK